MPDQTNSTGSPPMSGTRAQLAKRQRMKLLRRLAAPKAYLEKISAPCAKDPQQGVHYILVSRRAGDQTRSTTKVAAGLVRDLLTLGLVHDADQGLRLTREGRLSLKRWLSQGDQAFADQHRELIHVPSSAAPIDPAADKPQQAATETRKINLSESPLAWLARRKDKAGRALLEPDLVQAGEKLRTDYSFAQLMPTVAKGWRCEQSSNSGSPSGGAADLADDVIAARQRIERILQALEPVLADVLVDVCCHLKGLEAVEAERGWPARSGKVVLKIALGSLADHYGYRTRAPNSRHRIKTAHLA
ncbi:MAG: hypothetical protein HWE23_01785 [Rhodobacteraceae bacterium]|nr:hypothetical protein [Paracoccaceae bacterium]